MVALYDFQGTRRDAQNRLIIPARNIYGDITTIQTVSTSGEKRFLSGGAKTGSFFILDDQPVNPDDVVYICEGFATAASVQEATGKPTICAFDAGNLLPVAEALRRRYPDAELVICADDDTTKEHNTGRTKAIAAAIAVNCKVCFPSIKGSEVEAW